MIKNITFTIKTSDTIVGRLDKIILTHFPSSTRAFIAKAFSRGNISVDGITRPKAFNPPRGAVVHISSLLEGDDRSVIPEEGELNIIYSDADLIAINKPSGWPCHPVSPSENGTLANRLITIYPELIDIGDDPLMPGLLHRIDTGTSGLVLCARTPLAFNSLRAQFVEQTIKKTYTAVVHGIVREKGGISGYLAHSSSFRGRMRVVGPGPHPRGERAMFAETFYRPLDAKNAQTRLEVIIYTGVTHQIRCQLASIGHPIVGDAVYGTTGSLKGPHGEYHQLHATAIELSHPRTLAPLIITCPPQF